MEEEEGTLWPCVSDVRAVSLDVDTASADHHNRIIPWENFTKFKCTMCRPPRVVISFGSNPVRETTRKCKFGTDGHLAAWPGYALCKGCATAQKTCIECGDLKTDVFYYMIKAPMPPGMDMEYMF